MADRTFTRGLKAADIKTDEDMLTYVKSYHDTNRQSGMRALQDYVIYIIAGINPQTLKELLKVLNVVVPSIAGDALTQDIYTAIRKAIISRFGADSEMYAKSRTIMKFDLTKWRENKIEYIKKVAEANKNPKEYSFAKIKEVLINTHDGDYIDQLIFLQLCSGSRVGELIYFSKYEEVKDSKNFIKQIRVLKSKVDRDVIKPILFISPSEFIAIFNTLRATLVKKNITNAVAAQAINTTLNNRIKKLFDDTDVSTHDLRKLYGDLAFQVYSTNEKDTAYISMVLGHDINSVQVSTSYLTVAVHLTSIDKKVVRKMDFTAAAAADIPRNTTARDGLGAERLRLTVMALNQNNIAITARVLGSYGYGMRIINQYMATL